MLIILQGILAMSLLLLLKLDYVHDRVVTVQAFQPTASESYKDVMGRPRVEFTPNLMPMTKFS